MKINFDNRSINIVAYHYVREIKKSNYPNLKGIEYSKFKKQINYFKKNFNIISTEDLIDILDKKKIYRKPSLLLTFDDGYKDHYKYVFPLLAKEKIKACFYPPIDIFKQKVLNVNKIHFILEKCQDRKLLLETLNYYLKKNFNFNINNYYKNNLKLNSSLIPEYDDEATVLIKKILQKTLPENIRNKCCNFLFDKFVKIELKAFSKKLYLDLKQVKEMNDSGMHFGCHGINHIRWKSWNFNQQKREIESSKKFFKSKKIHTKNFSVCYPWGSYNNISSKVLKTLDIKFGLTSDKGNFKVNSKLNRFILPRFDANDFLNI